MKQEWTVELLGQKKGMELKLSAKAMAQCGQKNAA
jgi:hypothetical protein